MWIGGKDYFSIALLLSTEHTSCNNLHLGAKTVLVTFNGISNGEKFAWFGSQYPSAGYPIGITILPYSLFKTILLLRLCYLYAKTSYIYVIVDINT